MATPSVGIKTTETLADEIDKAITAIADKVDINKEVFILYYDLFKELEEHPLVKQYLAARADINIKTIKNTKLLFHFMLWNYFKGPQLEATFLNIYDEINDLVEILRVFAEQQESVLKLPTLEKMRAGQINDYAYEADTSI